MSSLFFFFFLQELIEILFDVDSDKPRSTGEKIKLSFDEDFWSSCFNFMSPPLNIQVVFPISFQKIFEFKNLLPIPRREGEIST